MMQLISKVASQKCNSSGNLQRSKLIWAVFENVVLSETLDDLDALEKLSFTFRSSRSQIIFKICLKYFAIFTGKHLYSSLFLIT